MMPVTSWAPSRIRVKALGPMDACSRLKCRVPASTGSTFDVLSARFPRPRAKRRRARPGRPPRRATFLRMEEATAATADEKGGEALRAESAGFFVLERRPGGTTLSGLRSG